jgi:hypothetical protein
VAVLCADGAGVACPVTAAVASGAPGLSALAVVAAGSWSLALATIPSAIRDPGVARSRAQVAVATGAMTNTVGAVWVLAASAPVNPEAAALLFGGLALSFAYLLLLRRLTRERSVHA